MTLQPNHNKYVKNIDKIIHIQKYNLKNANKFNIPVINNNNIDKTIGLL